jgi:AcrR family transcriptional regulator
MIEPEPDVRDRRSAVLDSALTTFSRFGYRKTSMDEIAKAARISRPGLYFLFSSKEELFRAAVHRGLEEDLAGVRLILGEAERPFKERLLAAFDQWAGRYIGPVSRDLSAVIADDPELLGDIVLDAPRRFAEVVTAAFRSSGDGLDDGTAAALAQTLISTSIGIKQQVQDRAAYTERFAIAIDLLLR